MELLKRLESFDVILLDYQLPDTDGKAVLTLIRQNPHFFRTPVLMLTAETSEETTREFIDLGAQAVLNKPFTPTKLTDAVTPYLSRR